MKFWRACRTARVTRPHACQVFAARRGRPVGGGCESDYMSPEVVIALVAAVAAVASLGFAWWSGRSAARSAETAERALTVAREAVAESVRLRRDQMGYSGGDYCINYRNQVLDLVRQGWTGEQIKELLYKESTLRRLRSTVARSPTSYASLKRLGEPSGMYSIPVQQPAGPQQPKPIP